MFIPKRVSASDLKSINKWLRANNHPIASESDLPTIGFIIPGVAAGFVRDCETGIGMLDSMVSNPLVSSSTRNKALDSIFMACLDTGFKGYIAFTEYKGLSERAISHGFNAKSHLMLIRGM